MEGKLVKAYLYNDTYAIRFDFGDEYLYINSDKTISHRKIDYIKIDALEQTDTLQEVVDWCRKNRKEFCITITGSLFTSDLFKSKTSIRYLDKKDLLNQIRKPKRAKISLEQLHAMGYELED